jgi:hypothetical protein
MLRPEEVESLVVTVQISLPGSAVANVIVAGYVGEALALTMPALPTSRQVAQWMVDRALERPDPHLLIRIVRKVDNLDPRMASLVHLADELEDDPARWRSTTPLGPIDWSTNGDPLNVKDGSPFVDRVGFRRLLPRHGSLDTPVCTVILGDRGDGKSYLHEFCKQLAQYWGQGQPDPLRVAYSECPSGNLSHLDATMVADDLAAGLGTDFTKRPRQHEDPERNAQNLLRWIVDYTPSRPLPALVMLDGFDSAAVADRVPQDVHLFIEDLVEAVQEDPEVAARMRVVLLGYDVGRLEARNLRYETSVLEWVDQQAVVDWFRKRYPGEPDYRYEDAAAFIIDRLPAQGPHRMRHLCSLVRGTTQQFEAP